MSATTASLCSSAAANLQSQINGFGLQKLSFSPPLLLLPHKVIRRTMRTAVKAMSRVDKFSKSDIIVSPSILSANFAKLGEQVKAVELAGCDWIHVDVMDGMIVEPDLRVPDFIKAGADIISVHCEQSSTIHLHRAVNQIKSLGAKAGVVLNPGTPLAAIEYVLDLFPGVNPWIEVDGGVTPKNAYKVIEAGANALVAGSAVFGAKDYAEAIKGIKTSKRPEAVAV
ncbi:hypothetical protein MKW92_007607 [Papaver armeniacum]|nr:hypothetical protein MKW92_007607 [Papaver armeniacum]